MAQNLQQLKKRIKSSQNIYQIAKAMEMISASKIKKSQDTVEKHNPYANKIHNMLQHALLDKDLKIDSMFSKEVEGKKLVYIISPDKGLCGGLVVNLFKKVSSYVSKDDFIIAIGKKAINNVVKNDYNTLATFNMGSNFPKYEDIFPMIELGKEYFLSGKVVKVAVIYTKFKNMLVQEPVIDEIFPIKPDENFKKDSIDYIFEPSASQVIKDLLPYYAEVRFYSTLMNAYASEHAARKTAMKNAKENASEISQSLNSIYNKSRQEKITNELLDLANGREEN